MPHPDDPKNPNTYHIKTYNYTEWEEILRKYFTDVKVYTFDNDSYWWSAKK